MDIFITNIFNYNSINRNKINIEVFSLHLFLKKKKAKLLYCPIISATRGIASKEVTGFPEPYSVAELHKLTFTVFWIMPQKIFYSFCIIFCDI